MSKGLTPFRRRLADRIPSGWLPTPVRDRLGTSTGGPEPSLTKPLDSSIRWTPAGYVDHPLSPEQPFDLFVDQSVIRDVMAHLLGARADDAFGVLSGKLLTCSSSKLRYVRIRNAHPAEEPFPETADTAPFRRHLQEAAERAASENEEVLGWYHPHNLLGVTLTARDSRLHMEHFHQLWHCALVIVPERRRTYGGFFSRLRGDGAFRSSAVPFFEVLEPKGLDNRPVPSYVGWLNYEADRSYTRLPPEQPGAAQTGGTRDAGGAREAGGTAPPDDDLEAGHPVVFELVAKPPKPVAEPPAPVEAARTEVESLEVLEVMVDETISAGAASEPVAPGSNGAGLDPEEDFEPGAREGQTAPVSDPLLMKRLEALRYIRALGEPPDQGTAHGVTREVADDPEAAADAVAAREFLWQRWSRRSARSQSAE